MYTSYHSNASRVSAPKDPSTRAQALGEIADTEAVLPLIDMLLRDRDWGAREESAKALGIIGDDRGFEPLLSVVTDRNSRPIRVAAAEALEEFGDPRSIEPLIALAEEEKYDNRVRVIRVLKSLLFTSPAD
jgi:HEAT repeat protein